MLPDDEAVSDVTEEFSGGWLSDGVEAGPQADKSTAVSAAIINSFLFGWLLFISLSPLYIVTRSAPNLQPKYYGYRTDKNATANAAIKSSLLLNSLF